MMQGPNLSQNLSSRRRWKDASFSTIRMNLDNEERTGERRKRGEFN
jgi:hypothetical protein